MPPKPEDIWDNDDDWTGLSSQQERRKRQNRLHQRAYRKKRHLKRLGLESEPANDTMDNASAEGEIVSASVLANSQSSRQTLALKTHDAVLRLVRCHDIHEKIVGFLRKATSDWGFGLLIAADLPILTRLNSLDGLARNAFIMGIPVELLDSVDGPSPFCLNGPSTQGTHFIAPAHLSPTSLQRSVRHHPWLDLFPIPKLRDNILEGIGSGELDEEELSQQLMCELLDFEATSSASLMIWGDSWNIDGWEFSPEFFVKWASLLKGCEEILHATNRWRAKRGEFQLSFDLR